MKMDHLKDIQSIEWDESLSSMKFQKWFCVKVEAKMTSKILECALQELVEKSFSLFYSYDLPY